ncbi:anoctamin-1-like isoform X2 [Anthonomus grandis grandis]|uniref:anoctamin-1-like isoform X2 n=1 Tax=Anthonomus grandis grandis TaxID=2921223 RepID=UPI0021656F38|nr:anoctamin-1-like isoform X2 [Anthonomus grandis grandis]
MGDETDEDDFYDTLSLASSHSKRKLNNNDYLALSRNTLYHSIVDLEGSKENMMEMSELQNHNDKNWTCMIDSELKVHFVLAYENKDKNGAYEKRRIFEENLQKEGLVLKRDETQWIHFLKIHVPTAVAIRYAELLKLRMPIKDTEPSPKGHYLSTLLNNCFKKLNVTLDNDKFPPEKYQLTAEFRKDQTYLFDIENENFFPDSVRIAVASYVLHDQKFGPEDQNIGIKQLIAEGVYKAAYPLHDGEINDDTSTVTDSKRNLLYHEWASVSKWVKFQPIDEIKDYFGVKFALYFTWLGFYTHMLIPASVMGIVCLLYGIVSLRSDTFSSDICKGNITMCPLCDKYCDYWQLKDTCTYSKIQHIIDNNFTVAFAIFMSVWAAVYLELWKRYSAEVGHRWGLTGFDLLAERPRPEYLLRLSKSNAKVKENVITHLKEPVVPFWRVRVPSIIFSFSVALFWALIALAVVVGVIIYRMSLATSAALFQDKASVRVYVVPITSGLINLLCIVILNMMYERLATWLTEIENQRTQTEFDDSLALKIYIFQFVNYYSCIFYIAFLKGKYVGYPLKYNKVFGYRQEECNPGGCLMELTIQLAIIMIGKQAVTSVLEMILPVCYRMLTTFISSKQKGGENERRHLIESNQMASDYNLYDLDSSSLFSEYLEMVIQYGFVTLFVTAFPLAPLFALINNVLEMRLDAKKFIKYYRRPVPQRVKNIGVWYNILAVIGRIAIVSNAMIIAFSSNFIPKLVYMLRVNPQHTEEGFLNFTLAQFNTSDFKPENAPIENYDNVTVCRYADFRNSYDDPQKYKRPIVFWHVLAARLAFVVVYQNFVSFIVTVIEWTIPDVSKKLNDRIKREAFKVNEIIISETNRAKREKASSLRKRKNRDSITSGSTIYHDTASEYGNGSGDNPRLTTYYDMDDS